MPFGGIEMRTREKSLSAAFQVPSKSFLFLVPFHRRNPEKLFFISSPKNAHSQNGAIEIKAK